MQMVNEIENKKMYNFIAEQKMIFLRVKDNMFEYIIHLYHLVDGRL